MSMISVFFFQAEDGIRDIGVDWSSDVCSSDLEQARLAYGPALNPVTGVNVHRGDLQEAERLVRLLAPLETSADIQERAEYATGASRLLLASGNAAEALRVASTAFEAHEALYLGHDAVKEAFVTACEASLAL